jgi:hypothetical protein
VLNVAGHVRLQAAAWVEQFDMHASEDASASRNLLAPVDSQYANAVQKSVNKTAVVKVNFKWSLLKYWRQQGFNPKCPNEPVISPEPLRKIFARFKLALISRSHIS